MITPELSLALSMQGNKGIYALLLGSGISISAGIPTGWDIVIDLIRKVAIAEGADCEPKPEEWYQRTTGKEPEYSALLGKVALSSAERGQLLRPYFEPSEAELEAKQKVPTPAHNSIAELVEKGYVRVIITTNFDRLLEQALTARGVQPTVIASADAALGALPLSHARCTVIKINGDYLDTRLRNTETELAAYDEALDRLLNRVFDDYGLVVCGWSASWDTALRNAIMRCPARRFTTFWASRGELSPSATDLVNHRAAAVITIRDADQFFHDLVDKVLALETFGAPDPISAKIAVARVKRYLSSPIHQITLHDFVHAETERAVVAANALGNPRSEVTKETIAERLRTYEAAFQVILPIVSCIAYWAKPTQRGLLLNCLQRVANESANDGRIGRWSMLRRYPALLVIYAMGIAAVAKQNARLLRFILAIPVRSSPYEPAVPAGREIFIDRVYPPDIRRLFPGREREASPVSNHLHHLLSDSLRQQIVDQHTYDEAFDWWEYLLGLNYLDSFEESIFLERKSPERSDQQGRTLPAPIGRFAWANAYGQNVQNLSKVDLKAPIPVPEFVAKLLKAGFFQAAGGTLDTSKYRLVKEALDEHAARVVVSQAMYG